MELTHSFTVPVDIATAWATFEDIAGVAECFPGAAVTSAEGDHFEGTVKVKLGPIALQYAGSGLFVERDETTRRLVLEAKGRDKRGNGTAGAHVTAGFVELDASSTRVEVLTDLQITGKPAQFGRGVMQEVSDKLLNQFVDCLEVRIGTPAEAPVPAGAPVTETPAAAPDGARTAAPSPEAATGAPGPAASETAPETGVTEPAAALGGPAPAAPAATDAIDLGRTVLPVLARAYGKWIVLGVVALVVLRWVTRRRR